MLQPVGLVVEQAAAWGNHSRLASLLGTSVVAGGSPVVAFRAIGTRSQAATEHTAVVVPTAATGEGNLAAVVGIPAVEGSPEEAYRAADTVARGILGEGNQVAAVACRAILQGTLVDHTCPPH